MSSIEFDNQDVTSISRPSFGQKKESPLVKFLIKNNIIKSEKGGIVLLIIISLVCIILAFYFFSQSKVKQTEQFKKPIPLIIDQDGEQW